MATQREVTCTDKDGKTQTVFVDRVKQQNFWAGSIQTLHGWGKLLVSYNTVVGLWVNGEVYDCVQSSTTSKQVSKYTGRYSNDDRRTRFYYENMLADKIEELTGLKFNCNRGGVY